MTEEEIKNKISEHKECCKKLAEEYRQRYNEDNTDKLALNMFYHNVISFNDFEIILATIEDRNSMMMCFSELPYLTEETVEVNIKRIAELEKETKVLTQNLEDSEIIIAGLKAQIEKMKCCENCKHAWCRTSSSSKDKEGKQIFHKWNNTKRKYCDVGKNGKYQCWELAD